jgi:hypothetical protein
MTEKFIKNFIGLALLTTVVTFASETTHENLKTAADTKICLTEACMSTTKLQEEVEKLSIEGKLPFEMGLELIKRWSDEKIS